MSTNRRQWVLNIILAIAVLALVGFSMLPLLNATLQAGQQPAPTPTTPQPSAVNPEARKADLEAQVKGYEMVLQREPENQTALQGIIEARLELLQSYRIGDPQSLVAPLEKLAALKSDQPNYMVLLAQTKEYLNDREGAAQAYRKALSQNPGNPYALTSFVNLYLNENKPEAALGLLKDTLANAPQVNQSQPGTINIATVQILLGEVYTKLQRLPEAITAYDAAIAAEPLDFRPYLGKARVMVTQGKVQDAKSSFDQAFKLAPANYKDAILKESEPTKTALNPTPQPTGQPEAATPTPVASPPKP